MKASPYHIEVAVALPVHPTYTYLVPEEFIPFADVGRRVLVPFGKQRVTGYILGPCEADTDKGIKPIQDILDEAPVFPETMIPFLRWTASYYMHPMGEVIKTALPGGFNLYERVTVSITEKGKSILASDNLSDQEQRTLKHIHKNRCSLKELNRQILKDIPSPSSVIRKMENSGLIIRHKKLEHGIAKPKMERFVRIQDSPAPSEGISQVRKKIFDVVSSEGEMPVKHLRKLVPTASHLIKSMEEKGHLSISHKHVYRDPFGESIPPDTAPPLTIEQEKAVTTVLEALGKGFQTYLLAGVTGSGKTEVYMQLAAAVLQNGYSVLVLVPEIALISQIERRFRARFGECVAVLHSGLSAGERYDQWMRILRNEVDIVIGARSAVFAPFSDLGLIIVDEEHDTSYKQEHQLRYNARDLAVVRAKLQNAVALLGSATPSVQSYFNSQRDQFIQLTLENRVENRSLPEITVLDLCRYRDSRGIRRFITPELSQAIKGTLNRNEQVILFLNRRGYASFPICSACGETIRCKNCDISLTLHQDINAYKCHYCGHTKASATDCPACGSSKIYQLGLGTEKVEQAMGDLFPEARIVRMDRDTTRRKGSLVKILKDLRAGSIDILVGTQMVAKGHDFPNITLVGIICADLSLNFPDFRAGERTFQLLAQVAGRAGRGDRPGRVILQTYNPDHFSIETAKAQDFKAFYEREITFRKTLNYPPFSRIVLIRISGKDKKLTEQAARSIGDVCREVQAAHKKYSDSVEVLGPISAPVSKIANRYRWQVLIKGRRAKSLHQFVRGVVFENPAILKNRSVKVSIDVDPMYMM